MRGFRGCLGFGGSGVGSSPEVMFVAMRASAIMLPTGLDEAAKPEAADSKAADPEAGTRTSEAGTS